MSKYAFVARGPSWIWGNGEWGIERSRDGKATEGERKERENGEEEKGKGISERFGERERGGERKGREREKGGEGMEFRGGGVCVMVIGVREVDHPERIYPGSELKQNCRATKLKCAQI